MASYHDSVADIIGNTPMVKLNRVVEGIKADKILVKLEMHAAALPPPSCWLSCLRPG